MSDGIVYLCGEYPRATDTFIQREVAALRSAGFRVQTVSIRRPASLERPAEATLSDQQPTFYVLPAGPLRLLFAHLRVFGASPARYLRALGIALTVRAPGIRALAYQFFYFAEAAIVADLMRREGFVHIHNHAPDASGYVALIASEMGGFTYSLTIHGHGILAEPGRWRLADKLARASFVVCVSLHGRSQAMLWSPPKHWAKFHVIHCGIDLGPYDHRQHESRGSRLIFVGRLDHVKGVPVLIEAMRLLADSRPDVHLDIVGDGPQRKQLETMVKDHGLTAHVSFHGYLGQAEVGNMLWRADAFVLSSFAEGIPVAMMEAMAAGVPVVAPGITGIPELVTHEKSGLLFYPADVASLVDAISRLLDDAGLRNMLAENGRETIEQAFNLNHETSKLVTLMRAQVAGG